MSLCSSSTATPPALSPQVLDIQASLQNLRAQADKYRAREQIFSLKETEWPVLDAIQKEFEPTAKLWELCASFTRELPDWRDGPFKEVKAELVAAKVDE